MDKDLRKELDEMKLMIMGLQTLVQNTGSNDGSSFGGVPRFRTLHKRVIKKLDRLQIMKTIKHYIEEGYRTLEIKDEILFRFGISSSCFYNYLRTLQTLVQNTGSNDGSSHKRESSHP